MKTPLAIAIATVAIAIAGLAFRSHAEQRARVTVQLEQFTGARTRVVWCRQVEGKGDDPMARGTNLVLMGLDTADDRGERQLLPAKGNYWKPMLTPRGDRVVYTDRPALTMFAVNWAGTSRLALGPGIALDVWLDAARDTEWVYAIEADSMLGTDSGGRVVRIRLDTPTHRELIWEKTPVSFDSLMVAQDGQSFGALFPWPASGIANVEAHTWRQLGKGCWTALAPDASRVLWVFDGAHRNVVMHTPDGARQWKVSINGAPGVDGFEVYHPRWSNHARFFSITGPYNAGSGENQIRSGGPGVEIHVGKFDEHLTNVTGWVRVTTNDKADFYPDVWVDPSARTPGAALVAANPATTPVPEARIVLDARLTETTPTPSAGDIAPYVHALVVHRYEVVSVVTGKLARSAIRVAHWGMRDARAIPFRGRRGETLRLSIEPYDNHPELEGERLVMGPGTQSGPLYYDVSSR